MSLRRIHPEYQEELRTTKTRLQTALKDNRRRRVSTTGKGIDSLIASWKTRESWSKIQRW